MEEKDYDNPWVMKRLGYDKICLGEGLCGKDYERIKELYKACIIAYIYITRTSRKIHIIHLTIWPLRLIQTKPFSSKHDQDELKLHGLSIQTTKET